MAKSYVPRSDAGRFTVPMGRGIRQTAKQTYSKVLGTPNGGTANETRFDNNEPSQPLTPSYPVSSAGRDSKMD